MISALSTTVGEGMIAKWPNRTFFPKDEINLCDACQCVCPCVRQVLLACLSRTWNFKTIFDICLKDWPQHWIFLTFNNSQQMCSARWNSTSVSPPESVFVQIGIVRRRKIQLHSSWQRTKTICTKWNTHSMKWREVCILLPHRGQQLTFVKSLPTPKCGMLTIEQNDNGWVFSRFYVMPAWWILECVFHIFIMFNYFYYDLCILCLKSVYIL